MDSRWVVNASPIILLGKIGRASLLVELSEELVIPRAVLQEVDRRAEGRRTLEALLTAPTTRVAEQGNVPARVELWDLGPGESQVLAFGCGEPGATMVLDDLEARRCARSLDLAVIGTLGIVLRAKSTGNIARARPVLEELRRSGLYVTEQLFEQTLRHLGE